MPINSCQDSLSIYSRAHAHTHTPLITEKCTFLVVCSKSQRIAVIGQVYIRYQTNYINLKRSLSQTVARGNSDFHLNLLAKVEEAFLRNIRQFWSYLHISMSALLPSLRNNFLKGRQTTTFPHFEKKNLVISITFSVLKN